MKLIHVCAVVVSFCTAVMLAGAGSALAARAPGDYTLVVSPTAVAGGTSTTFHFTLGNSSSSGVQLGSADFTPPAGFSLTAASLPAGKRGNASLLGNIVALRGLGLRPGSVIDVSVTAVAACGSNPKTWTSLAEEDPNLTGRPLTLNRSRSSVTTTVTGTCAVSICRQGGSCHTSLTSLTSVFSVIAKPSSDGPNAAILSEALDLGTPLQCQGYTRQDPNWFSFLVSSSNRSKLITYAVRPAAAETELVGNTKFCLGASSQFTTGTGTPAPAGTLPDGSAGFIGLLPFCSRVSRAPCVDSRGTSPDANSPTGFDVLLRVLIPARLAGDPWGGA
jgi:hypothetical protein